MGETATATISATEISPDSWSYSITLKDTGTEPISTFWLGWVPGEDFLDSQPSDIASPSGWSSAITHAGAGDGYAIQWTTSSSAVAADGSLAGFTFTSSDSPAQMFGDSNFYPGTPALTSFVYSGAPFSGGSFQFQVEPLCYLAGTRILTPSGEVPVETLREGDLIVTASGAHRPLRWIGFGRTLVTPRNRDRATPVVVRKHALGEFVPRRDLYITRGHALYLEGVLIPVEELINHRSIAWVEDARVVEYYHLELDNHDVVLAEGAAAETYRDDDNSPLFLNAATRPRPLRVPPYAPVLHDHETVRRIWRKLSDRAGRLDLALSENADLHLLADGVRLYAEAVEGQIWRFRLPGPARNLRVASRSAIPSMLGTGQDQRRLGVALRGIVLAQAGLRIELGWESGCLADGFHGAEPVEGHRWTSGAAAVPTDLLAPFAAGATVELHVSGAAVYPVEVRTQAEAA